MKQTSEKRQSGFTMIEIMVVVVIVAILAAIAVPTYVKYVESARASEAKSVIGNIDNAAKMYYHQWLIALYFVRLIYFHYLRLI